MFNISKELMERFIETTPEWMLQDDVIPACAESDATFVGESPKGYDEALKICSECPLKEPCAEYGADKTKLTISTVYGGNFTKRQS